MNAKQAREFYLEYITTIYNEGRVDQLERFYAPDVVPHPPVPGAESGLEGFRQGVKGFLEAFSEVRLTLVDFVFEKDIMAPRITMTGIHVGNFMGIPATGRRMEIADHPHYRLRDGKIVEYWDMPDLLTLMIQLGAIPAPGQGT
ncbi:ester cyclase [Archangium minus]|uniref:Ester cyclase n=1 Tax=Archangium minus TaxID=83450 RepID=A0ABY9WP35_9BACT|nr:ester cyclase [Archangium minus]